MDSEKIGDRKMNFPREVANPKRKLVYNMEQYLDYIQKNAPYKSVYTSVFSFSKLIPTKYGQSPDYKSADLEMAFFDFDSKNCYENMRKFHQFLSERSILHRVNFSGGGFHILVYLIDNQFLEYPKDALFNAQKWLADQCGLTIGMAQEADLDSAVIGDLARIRRIEGTYNHKRKLFCTPLDMQTIELPFEQIKELAKTQQFLNGIFFGTKKFPLKPFDRPRTQGIKITIPEIKSEEMLKNDGFYPCVRKMLEERSGFKAWFYAVTFLRDKGYTKEEATEVLKKYLSKWRRDDGWADDFSHCMSHDHTIDCVYRDPLRYAFPTCATIFLEGFCVGKCPFMDKHYFHRSEKNV